MKKTLIALILAAALVLSLLSVAAADAAITSWNKYDLTKSDSSGLFTHYIGSPDFVIIKQAQNAYYYWRYLSADQIEAVKTYAIAHDPSLKKVNWLPLTDVYEIDDGYLTAPGDKVSHIDWGKIEQPR